LTEGLEDGIDKGFEAAANDRALRAGAIGAAAVR
jgi:hypothetical protein